MSVRQYIAAHQHLARLVQSGALSLEDVRARAAGHSSDPYCMAAQDFVTMVEGSSVEAAITRLDCCFPDPERPNPNPPPCREHQ
jgi:hypothetical protein